MSRPTLIKIAIATVAAIALILGAYRVPAPVTSSDYAAWAQGIGTIAAVMATMWVGLIPVRLETTRRNRERRDFIDALLSAAKNARLPLASLRAAVDSKDLTYLRVRTLAAPGSGALTKLLAEPMSAWPSMYLYTLALELKEVLDAVDGDHGLTAAATEDDVVPDVLWEIAGQFHDEIDSLTQDIARAARVIDPSVTSPFG